MYPIIFATYHTIYGAHTTTSTPTIAFVLISPVHTDEQNTPHLMHLTLCPCLTLALILCLTLMLTLHTMLVLAPHPPPLLSYLFTPLALLSGCI